MQPISPEIRMIQLCCLSSVARVQKAFHVICKLCKNNEKQSGSNSESSRKSMANLICLQNYTRWPSQKICLHFQLILFQLTIQITSDMPQKIHKNTTLGFYQIFIFIKSGFAILQLWLRITGMSFVNNNSETRGSQFHFTRY